MSVIFFVFKKTFFCSAICIPLISWFVIFNSSVLLLLASCLSLYLFALITMASSRNKNPCLVLLSLLLPLLCVFAQPTEEIQPRKV